MSTEIVDGDTRYRLLQTIRAYALEKLAFDDEYDALVHRHAERRGLALEPSPASAWLRVRAAATCRLAA